MNKFKLNHKKHRVSYKTGESGNVYLHSQHLIDPVVSKTGDWLELWMRRKPNEVFLAERKGDGWQKLSYSEAREKVTKITQSFVKFGLEAGDKIMIIAPNSLNHALLSLAGQQMGLPVAPVAVQYAMFATARDRLEHILTLIKPKLIYLPKAIPHAIALIQQLLPKSLIVLDEQDETISLGIDDFLVGDDSVDVERHHPEVHANTIAKILLTSGSTDHPKGVVTTHKMMCVNQSQIASVLPFIREKPPVLLDWLPWNHVFGGSHNFNLVLANGGSLYIDDGKPTEELFHRTVENQLMVEATIAFNVPVGFSMLLQNFISSPALAEKFFARLDMIFYAGASLPQKIWQGLEEMAEKYSGKIPLITSSWGMTETAPACLLQHESADKSGIVGVPLPNISVKLIPDENSEGRYEVRVKGDSVTQGYYMDDRKTKDSFDDEGYFITGDAMKFVNPDDFNQGLQFDGRIGENFKLITGTWVNVSELKVKMLDKLAPYAADVIITGENLSEIGMMIVPHFTAIKKEGIEWETTGKNIDSQKLATIIATRLKEYNAQSRGSSRQIKRALLLASPPSFAKGELTAKGNINVKHFLTNNADLVELLYQQNTSPIITSEPNEQ